MDMMAPDALRTDPLNALRELIRCEDELEKLRQDGIKAVEAAGTNWK